MTRRVRKTMPGVVLHSRSRLRRWTRCAAGARTGSRRPPADRDIRRDARCVSPTDATRRARHVESPRFCQERPCCTPSFSDNSKSVRWTLDADVPWHAFDAAKLTDEQARTVKMNAITEWAALPATEMFLRDNHDDSDFCAFMSIWFYEEQKHALVLMEYLRRFRPGARADRG